MDYLDRLVRGIEFIESNLHGVCNLQNIAVAACLSPFHFHRTFTALTGETPGDYVRSRKLTIASIQLAESNTRILEIAIECGYESQEAFSRAFKKHFRDTPKRFREKRYSSHFLRRAALNRSIIEHLLGGLTMEPKIVVKKEFTLVGVAGKTSKSNNRIGDIWQRFFTVLPSIPQQLNTKVNFGVGEYINPAEFTDDTDFTYFAGVEVEPSIELSTDLVKKTIPERRWAVFTHQGGVDTLLSTYDYIYGPWIVRSNEEILEVDDMEIFDSRFKPENPSSSEIDIYIPVK